MASIRVFPEALPAALVAGHGFEPLPNARRRERDQGESRMRPRYRSVPEMCMASWLFDQEQFDVFHDWFEDALLAGSLDFDVRVQYRGTEYGTTWHTALFPEGYSAEVTHGLLYRITAPLLLREALGPVRLAPGISAAGGITFIGGVMLMPFTIEAAGAISFSGGVRPALATLSAAGGIEFNGGFSPGQQEEIEEGNQARQTDDGATREIDEGSIRITDEQEQEIPVPAETDPYIDSVVMLLLFNEDPGMTSFADDSPIGRMLSATGDVESFESETLFGTNVAALFDGGHILLDSGAPTPTWHDFALTPWDFTFDSWVFIPSGSGSGAIWSNHDFASGSGIEIQINAIGGSHKLRLKLDGAYYPDGGSFQPIPLNEWAHIEVSRSGFYFYLFVNGVLSGSPILGGFNHPSSADVRLGDTSITSSLPLDHVAMKYARLTKGVCRHTESFQPPGPIDPTRTGDPSWSNVVLLLKGEGDNNSTSIVDSSSAERSLTANGSLVISTEQARFGSSSIRTYDDFLDPAGYIEVSTGSVPDDFDFSSGVFTFESWVWLSSTSSTLHTLFTARNDGTDTQGLKIEIVPTGVISVWCDDEQLQAVGYALGAERWEHLMVTGDGSDIYIIKNGILVASAPMTITTPTGVGVRIGLDNAGSAAFHGFMQFVRITKGVCRSTSDRIAGSAYCPPVTPYQDY